jgi:hypothetical protein
VRYHDGQVVVQPIEQKLSAKGEWSKGRNVAMSRLFNRTNLDYLSQQDLAICGALKREHTYYYGDSYFLYRHHTG